MERSKSRVKGSQASRVRRTYAGFVVEAVENAAFFQRQYGTGVLEIDVWTRSLAGREILRKAGLRDDTVTVDYLRQKVMHCARDNKGLTRRELIAECPTLH